MKTPACSSSKLGLDTATIWELASPAPAAPPESPSTLAGGRLPLPLKLPSLLEILRSDMENCLTSGS